MAFTRVYKLPSEASEVICQYEPQTIVSCIIPAKKARKVRGYTAKGGRGFIQIETPAIVMIQKDKKTRNPMTQKQGDIFLHRLVERGAKQIFVENYLWAADANGNICWGHTNMPDPRNLREANIRYWGTTMQVNTFKGAAYNNFKTDATKKILGDKYISFQGKVEAILVSDDPKLLMKFPTPEWTKSGKRDLIICSIRQTEKGWVAKVQGKTIRLGKLPE